MSQNIKEIIWDIPKKDVQIGVPIGYEAEFSLNNHFSPILYRLTTYEEITASTVGTFYYSLDNGETWINFPVGEGGQAFYQSYKMKLVIKILCI